MSGISILLVDDSLVARTFIKRNLKNTDYTHAEVIEAADGEKALNIIRDHPTHIDVILSDINMPNMDGITFVTRVRELERKRGKYLPTPIIMITSENTGEVEKRAVESGVTAYITKPFKIEHLVETLEKVLLH